MQDTNLSTTDYKRPILVFIAYVYKDQKLLMRIGQILETLQMQGWNIAYHSSEVGLRWADQSEYYLDTADLILLLISPDFIATKYCYSEHLKRAIKRHKEKHAYVIPILLRTCAWNGTPFARLAPLPEGGEAVNKWSPQDDAFHNIAEGIRNALQYLENRL